MATSQDFWNWVCGSKLLPEYLNYQFKSMGPVFDSLTMGSTHKTMYQKDAASLEIVVPPIVEQRAIVDYLDRETARIDTLIEEQQRLIDLLRERLVAEIVSSLDVPGYQMTRLKHVSTVQTGVTLSGEGDPADEEWPYLRVANVQVGYVDLAEIKFVRVPAARAAASLLQRGDVLMTEGGDIDKLGRGALWCGELPRMLHQNHIFAVRPTEVLDSEFLVHWLDGPVARTYFRTTAKQTTNLAGTNKWILGNLPVALPLWFPPNRGGLLYAASRLGAAVFS
jgi:type I restriction enzyme S subunit